MFAVPGWNVTAKSLVQEQSKPVKEKSQNSSAVFTADRQIAPTSKKRKRDQDTKKQGPNSTSKPQSHPTRETAAPRNDKKHKSAHHNDQAGSSNTRQNGRKNNRKGPRSDKITGANTEPVGSISGRRANSTNLVPQISAKNTTASIETTRAGNSKQSERDSAAENSIPLALPPIPPAPTHLTPLQAKMRAKLTSARFRHLNETLYTTSSSDALELFSNSPDLFAEYHTGFSQQVKDSWPQNPVDVYIKNVKSRGSLASPVTNAAALPRRKPGLCTIADLGCGDAPLARGLQSVMGKLNLKLLNFDLHAPNSLVTTADISALPLRDGEVDIAVFCLSLMGTNWLSFVEEAWRVLRGDGKGEIWVAEVKSRFGRLSARKGAGKVVENSVGKRRKPLAGEKDQSEDNAGDAKSAFVEDEREVEKPGADDDTDLQPFIDSFQRRGLMLKENAVDKSNKMFVSMVFTKTGVPRAGKWKGMKFNGKEYQRMEDKRRGPQQNRSQGGQRYFADEDEVDEKEEGKLLKPCVYKLR